MNTPIKVVDLRKNETSTATISIDSSKKYTVKASVHSSTSTLLLPSFIDLHASITTSNYQQEAQSALDNGITHILSIPQHIPNQARPTFYKITSLPLPHIYNTAPLTHTSDGKRLPLDYREVADAGINTLVASATDLQHSKTLLRCLQLVKSYAMKVVIQPHWLPLCWGGHAHQGVLAARKGLNPISPATESIALYIIKELVHYTQMPVHCAGISCSRSVEIIAQMKRDGLPITADTPITHLIYTDNDIGDFDTRFKLWPPLRSSNDRNALIDGINDGTIDAITSFHARHNQTDKHLPFASAAFGAPIFDDFAAMLNQLLVNGKISQQQIVASCCTKPACILGIENNNSILWDTITQQKRKNSRKNSILDDGIGVVTTVLNDNQVIYTNPDY